MRTIVNRLKEGGLPGPEGSVTRYGPWFLTVRNGALGVWGTRAEAEAWSGGGSYEEQVEAFGRMKDLLGLSPVYPMCRTSYVAACTAADRRWGFLTRCELIYYW